MNGKKSIQSCLITGILLITFINTFLYSGTFAVPFVFDDLHTIVETEGEGFFQGFLRDIYNPKAIFQLHPLRFITYYSIAFNYHLGNLQTFGYHLLNTLFHVFTSILVFFLAFCSLRNSHLKSFSISLLASFTFSLLPIHTETVTYIISRATGISAFFFILALYMYAIACRSSMKGISLKSSFYFFFTLFSFAASVISKEVTIVFPIIIIGFDYFFLKKSPLKYRVIGFYLPLFCLGILSCILYYPYYSAFIEGYLLHTFENRDLVSNLIIQFNIVPFIIKTLCLPININIDYDFSGASAHIKPSAVIFFSLSAFISYLLWKIKSPIISFSILWFIITLLPTNSIFPRATPLSDHNLYLPSLAFCLIFSCLIFYMGPKNQKTLNKLSLFLLLNTCLLLSTLTISRNHIYRRVETLWEDTVKKSPNMPRPYVNLGNACFEKGKVDEAIDYYRAALRIEPGLAEANNDLGAALIKKGNLDEAILYFSNALLIYPRYEIALKNIAISYGKKGLPEKAVENFQKLLAIHPGYAEVHYDLGKTLEEQGKLDEAMAHYSEALRLKPHLENVNYSIGILFAKLGKFEDAERYFLHTLRINPNNAEAHNSLGIIFSKKGQLAQALDHFHQALKIQPDNENAHNNIGTLLSSEGKNSEAIIHFKKALQINPENPEAYFNIGTLFLAEEKYTEAAASLLEAIKINPNYPEALFNLGIISVEEGRIEEGQAFFSKAVRFKPEMEGLQKEILRKYSSK